MKKYTFEVQIYKIIFNILKVICNFVSNSGHTHMHCISKLILTALSATILSDGISASVLNIPDADAATIGIQIREIATDRDIVAEDVAKAMIPASILKCVTCAAALTRLGSNYCFETRVAYSGTADGNILHGDLVIIPSGDPTLSNTSISGNTDFIAETVTAVKNAGISHIDGAIIVDDSAYSDQGQIPQWVIEDTAWDYGAGWYALNYAGNTYTLNLTTGYTSPQVPEPDLVLIKKEGSTTLLRGMNSDLLTVEGTKACKTGQTIVTSMNDPTTAFILNLTSALNNAGISVADQSGKYPLTATNTILTHKSPASLDVMRHLMQKSDNLMAEGMLRALAPKKSRNDALTTEKNILSSLGLSVARCKLADGSGLARTDRISPSAMTNLLKLMANGSYAEQYVSLFPKVGKEGTVRNFLKGTALEGQLVLKSGSMNGVHCYAGYKLGNDGQPTHTVVIMVNNFFCSRDVLRKALANFLLTTF